MNDNRIPEDALVELINQLLNGNISSEDFQRLSAELEQCAQARAVYIENTNLHSELTRNFRLESDNDVKAIANDLDELILVNAAHQLPLAPNVQSSSTLFPNIPFSGSVAFWLPTILSLFLIGAVAAFIINGGLVENPTTNYVSNSSNRTQPSMQSTIDIAAEQKGVALLTKDVNAVWNEGGKIQIGKPIAPGMVGLKEGLIQIDFFCGATMILEGPARLEITDENSGFVHYGKLRVFVPEQAKGFTLLSKQCEVVDLGTEFAMNVDSEKGAEVHVLEGEVRVKDASADANEELLVGGKAARFAGNMPAENVKLETDRFVGPAEFQRLSRKAQNAGLDCWMDGMDEIRKDNQLLALYTFQEPSKWDRLLVNSRPESNDIGNGAIIGCEWIEGRWKNKRGLKFSSPSHRVRINVPGLFDAISLSAWVKVDNYGHKIALTHPDTKKQKNYIHWTLDSSPAGDKSSLHFAVTDLFEGEQSRCHYSSIETPFLKSDLNQWVHVGVTYDPVNQVVTHYKNGREFASSPINRVQKVGLGVANIGNWPFQKWAKGTKFEIRNMEGVMDEFIALSRVLSPEDMAEIYEFGKPAQQ
ncbi:MAG: LamG-like jellyroll fold domain-containing protein [Mariniblastus sp.]